MVETIPTSGVLTTQRITFNVPTTRRDAYAGPSPDTVDKATATFLAEQCPLIDTPPHPRCDTCVVIPARDEAEGLPETLAALAAQVALDGRPIDPTTWEVIILANNCRDATADVARNWAKRQAAPTSGLRVHVAERELPDGFAHIGVARRLLLDTAAARMALQPHAQRMLISTDADTLPAPTWLAANRAEIAAGADAVGGRILVQRDECLDADAQAAPATTRRAAHRARRAHLHDVTFRALADELRARLDPQAHDAWPRHFQHFGPSIAVTVEAYRAVGGLPPCPWHEDVAFIERLRAIDARIRHSPLVRVQTSARASERTGFGFAAQLDQWHQMQTAQQPHLMRNPQGIATSASARHALRRLWQALHRRPLLETPDLHALATDLAVDTEWLDHAVRTAPTFGLLWQRIVVEQERTGEWLARWPQIDIVSGIAELRGMLAPLRAAEHIR